MRETEREREWEREKYNSMYVHVCLFGNHNNSHKWEMIPDKWFCLKSRPSLGLLSHHLGPWRSRWPSGYMAPLTMWNLSSTDTSHQENRRAIGWKTTGWHEVPWEPVRSYGMMCQDPGKDGCDDHVILSPWHRKNTPESPASIPEGLKAKVQWTLGIPGMIPALSIWEWGLERGRHLPKGIRQVWLMFPRAGSWRKGHGEGRKEGSWKHVNSRSNDTLQKSSSETPLTPCRAACHGKRTCHPQPLPPVGLPSSPALTLRKPKR